MSSYLSHLKRSSLNCSVKYSNSYKKNLVKNKKRGTKNHRRQWFSNYDLFEVLSLLFQLLSEPLRLLSVRNGPFRMCFSLIPIFRHHNQCWGSRSTWIRIHQVVLDPDPYWECGSGSRSIKNWPKFTNKPGFLPFKKACVPTFVGMFFDLLPTLNIFFMSKFNFL